MGSLPAPPAQRLRRPSWRDGRLVTGLLLMLAATVLGSSVVARADDAVPVRVAAVPLVPGQTVTEGDLRSARVRLGELAPQYLSGDAPLTAGTVVLRAVPEGHLVPASALGSRRDLGLRVVTVPVDEAAASVLTVGSEVDLWASVRKETSGRETWADPERALEGATVTRLPADTEQRLGGSTVSVQLLVPGGDVGEVISFVDRESKITLVPTAGTPLREGRR